MRTYQHRRAPRGQLADYVEGFRLTRTEFRLIREDLAPESRRFLVKQGHSAVVCQLNLRGMDDALAVISASTDNIDIMHQVLEKAAHKKGVTQDDLVPADWLQDFFANRKGSGKGPAKKAASDTAAA